ncbi:MAG: hypothetical protein R2747_00340 [Pyrinomonadaceae bacterium]
MNYILFFIFIIVFVCSGYAKEPEWLIKLRKLQVLESNKADVEREFSFPKVIDASDDAEKEKNGEKYITYQTKDGVLEVDYSTGTCSELNSSFGYDVVSGTITEIGFEPKKPVKASLLNFDYDSFKLELVDDMPGLTIYRNLEEDIKINIRRGNVKSLRFSPSAKYDYLECGKIKK